MYKIYHQYISRNTFDLSDYLSFSRNMIQDRIMSDIVKLHLHVLFAQSDFILHIDDHKPAGVGPIHAYYHDYAIK